MRAVAVVPARLASTRLPRKPLLAETGLPMVVHVLRRVAEAASLADVVVATDAPEIVEAVERHGFRAMMTRADHPTGSDRIGEILARLDADVVVNVQGDEPEIAPSVIDRLVARLADHPELDVATAATPLKDATRFGDPNVVKVVLDRRGEALYFSRSPIPGHKPSDPAPTAAGHPPLQHVGIYAYRRAALERFLALPPSVLERTESLEQLRLLEDGARYGVIEIPEAHRGIDTPSDYADFVARWFANSGN